MKPSVYLETTIPSYLTGWPSRDPIRAGQQQATRTWWAQRDRFDLFISQLVLDECGAGDPRAAAARLSSLEAVPTLQGSSMVALLARQFVSDIPLPDRAEVDAAHIAIAAWHQVDFLLTWNCRHIANAVFRPRIEAICRAAGCRPPVICTPDQLLMKELSNG